MLYTSRFLKIIRQKPAKIQTNYSIKERFSARFSVYIIIEKVHKKASCGNMERCGRYWGDIRTKSMVFSGVL